MRKKRLDAEVSTSWGESELEDRERAAAAATAIIRFLCYYVLRSVHSATTTLLLSIMTNAITYYVAYIVYLLCCENCYYVLHSVYSVFVVLWLLCYNVAYIVYWSCCDSSAITNYIAYVVYLSCYDSSAILYYVSYIVCLLLIHYISLSVLYIISLS